MQLLSQVFSVKMAYGQLITIILSIYKNFSLGLLCKAFHNKPGEVYPDERTENKEKRGRRARKGKE